MHTLAVDLFLFFLTSGFGTAKLHIAYCYGCRLPIDRLSFLMHTQCIVINYQNRRHTYLTNTRPGLRFSYG
jgi:hypothetical protein